MKRRSVKEKLKTLEECNTRLYSFLEKAGKIQGNSGSEDLDSQMPALFVPPLHIIQENASRVHSIIQRNWCHGRCEHDLHRAGLLLEPRLSRRRRKALKNYPQAAGKKNRFEFSFSRGTASSWLAVEFTLDEYSAAVPRYEHMAWFKEERGS